MPAFTGTFTSKEMPMLNASTNSAILKLKLRLLQIASQVGMWLWPAFTVGMWLFLERFPASQLQEAGLTGPGWHLPEPLGFLCQGASAMAVPPPLLITWKVKFLAMAASLFPAVVQFLFMRQWVELFGLYQHGIVFETRSVKCFARMGKHLLALAIYGIVFSKPLYSLALTADNPPGKHILSIGFSSNDLPVLAVGIALVVIAWAMDEGRKLRQEADLVV